MTGGFEIKNLALEANQAMRQGGLHYKGGLQGKIKGKGKISNWSTFDFAAKVNELAALPLYFNNIDAKKKPP